jgi:hypothetical protein
MARLIGFGKDAAHALSELGTVDLEAIALSDAWGPLTATLSASRRHPASARTAAAQS